MRMKRDPSKQIGVVMHPGLVGCPYCGVANIISPGVRKQTCFECKEPMMITFDRGQAAGVIQDISVFVKTTKGTKRKAGVP